MYSNPNFNRSCPLVDAKQINGVSSKICQTKTVCVMHKSCIEMVINNGIPALKKAFIKAKKRYEAYVAIE